MILVDKELREYGEDIFVRGYDEKNINAVSYDVTIHSIITDESEVDSYILDPNETIFIKTKEMIHVPDDLLGRIGEKNSKMRLGLQVSGPHYFPGHKTFMFLRVRNISPNRIKIENGEKIAQIFFEKLSDVPDKTYPMQEGASFNYEEKYRGIAGYKDEYNKKIIRIENAKEELEEKESKIYANIMTLMGIFVSIFSLIMVNFTNLTKRNMDIKFLAGINISLAIVIVLFLGLILIFLNKSKNRKFLIGYFILLLALIIGMFFVLY
ncbi:MAG: hypothetical protein SOZ48_04820 [Eubacterium sp.]|nr:hypothetical protein [Eubacterium sp.]